MDCEKLEPSNGKKLSKFSEAVLNKKPVFDPSKLLNILASFDYKCFYNYIIKTFTNIYIN